MWNNTIAYCLCFIVTLNSCKTIQILGENKKIKALSEKKLIETILANEIDIKWLKSRGNAYVQFEDDKEEEIDFNIRIKKDSLVWINLSKFKKKIVRAAFSSDTIKLAVEFPKKLSYYNSFESLTDSTNLSLSYSIFEHLLCGGSFIELLSKDLSSDIENNQYHIYSKDLTKNNFEVIYQSWIDPMSYKSNRINIYFPSSASEIDVFYSEWTLTENVLVPFKIKVVVKTNSNEYSIDLIYKSFKFDLPQKFPGIKIDKKYEPIIFNDK